MVDLLRRKLSRKSSIVQRNAADIDIDSPRLSAPLTRRVKEYFDHFDNYAHAFLKHAGG
jgi:hypothetical protein